ncbi:MAG: hypothetical protein V9G19_10875 [Tetrasphaera sp.]
MINALTDAGLRIDVWLHDEAQTLDPAKVKVLTDRSGEIQLEATPETIQDSAQLAAGLLAQIEEFWRCIVLLPTVIGRRELFGLLLRPQCGSHPCRRHPDDGLRSPA